MANHIRIKLPNYDTRGMYLIYNSELKEITKPSDIKITTNYKILLRIKVNNKTGKKTFDFPKSKTLVKAIEIVNDKRLELRETLKSEGTLREKRKKPKQSSSFKHVWKRYIEERSIELSEGTIRAYSSVYSSHLKQWDSIDINELGRDDVQKVVNTLVAKGNKYASVKTVVMAIKAFFNRQKIVIDWDSLSMPKKISNIRHYDLSLEDTKRIAKAMREHYHPQVRNVFVWLLRGRRIGEVLSMRYENIDLDKRIYRIRAEDAKGKKELEFILDDELYESVLDMGLKDEGLLFNVSQHYIRKMFNELLKSLNLPHMKIHDIRHMVATTMVQNGVPIQNVSRALGHSSIAITEARYVTKSKEQANQATNAFLEMIG